MDEERGNDPIREVTIVAADVPQVPIAIGMCTIQAEEHVSARAFAIGAIDNLVSRRDFKRRVAAGEITDEGARRIADDYADLPDGPYTATCEDVTVTEAEAIEILRHAWPFTGGSRHRKGPELLEAIQWVLDGRRVEPEHLANIHFAKTREDLEQGINVYPYPTYLAPNRLRKQAPSTSKPTGPSPLTNIDRLTIFSDPHSQATMRGIWAVSNGATHLWKNPPRMAPYYQDPDTNVLVYIGGAQGDASIEPAEAERAWRQVLALDDRKVSAFIICMGKWFADTGGSGPYIIDTRIHATDILAFRGVKKHVNGGYRPEQKQETREDILALNSIWVRSEQEIIEERTNGRKRKKQVSINSRLFDVAIENDKDLFGEEAPYAFRIRPGVWAEPYLGEHNRMTALLLQPIMRYDLRYAATRFAMRLGIYLTIQWRIRGSRGNYDQPWLVKTLLDGACIPVETDARLYSRFRGQVEEAFDKLQDDGVLRWEYVNTDDDQLPARGWFPEWLKWRVWIRPPTDIPEHYKRMPARRNRSIAAAKAASKAQPRLDECSTSSYEERS